MNDQLIELGKVAAALAALAGLAILLGKAVRGMIRTVRKLGRLADEVLGDGTRPGWGARLTALEKSTASVAEAVRPNGGSSMRDAVDRIEQATVPSGAIPGQRSGDHDAASATPSR